MDLKRWVRGHFPNVSLSAKAQSRQVPRLVQLVQIRDRLEDPEFGNVPLAGVVEKLLECGFLARGCRSTVGAQPE